MTLFKGVYPLYIDRDEEQMYCYYAGGYATRAEAERAKLQLSERGFRAPQICRWADGEGKEISRAGDGEYVVGTYADRAVADRLAEMIGRTDPRLGVEVMEIEVE